MSRRSILLLVGLFLAGALLGAGWQLVRRPSIREKELFLPEAKMISHLLSFRVGRQTPLPSRKKHPHPLGRPNG